MIEHSSAITDIWRGSEGRLGYGSGRAIAEDLVQSGILPEEERDYAGRYIDHKPTREFLYPKSEDTLRALLTEPSNSVVIWTQGEPRQQAFKVASSGILQLRRDPELSARNRLGVFTAFDKVTQFPTVVGKMPQDRKYVVVDDKSENVVRVTDGINNAKRTGELDADLDISIVWINQGRTKDHVPEGVTLEEFKDKYRTIGEIEELATVYQDAKNTTFFVDWDHTLCNTGEWRKSAQREIANQLARRPIVGFFKDKALGLADHTVSRTFSNGNSGAGVKHTVGPDGNQQVVKYQLHDRTRLMRETDGYRILRQSPLNEHLVPIDDRYIHRGVLLTPYCEGVSMREGIQKGVITPDIAESVYRQLLELKAMWWSSQAKKSGDKVRSMQRGEWQDTLKRLHEQVIPSMAGGVKLSPERLLHLPLSHNGITLPPIGEVLAYTEDHLSHQKVPYTIDAHNDATGANIIVDPTGSWKLFDYEWAGPNDPAEAMARMVKQVSVSTVKDITASLDPQSSVVRVDVSCDVPDAAQRLQKIGLHASTSMEKVMGDPDLSTRMQRYLVGSYLREAALSTKRGGTPAAIFALTNAARIMTSFEVYP